MKNKVLVVICAIIFTVTMLAGCGGNDNPAANTDASEVGQEDIDKLIIGSKWMPTEVDGQPMLTNQKLVYNFTSSTTALISGSSNGNESVIWSPYTEAEVAISGNEITITSSPTEHMTIEQKDSITSINQNEYTAESTGRIISDGKVVHSSETTSSFRFIKVNEDYSEDIIGTWEGRCTSEGSVFDDGQDHRWEYREDGTYIYYMKDGDSWVPSDNTLNEYFVAGNLLCTRWMSSDEENREWWEITIDTDTMRWTALRTDENGETFIASFEMQKVE